MSQDETMRLVATVVDGYSGPLKNMIAALKKVGDGSKEIHDKGAKNVNTHAQTYAKLGDQIRKVKDNGVNVLAPSLAALGVTTYGLSEGMGKLVETLKGAGERWNVLNEVMKRGGVTPTYVNALGRAFERMGMDAGKADAAVAGIGETLDKLKSNDPQEMNRLTGVFGNLLPFLGEITQGAKNREEEMTRIAGAVTDKKYPLWQRRKLAEAFGIDPALAAKSGEEFGKAFRESMQRELDHRVDPKTLEGLRDAFAHLSQAQRDYRDDMISVFGPPRIRLVEGFAKALDDLGKKYRERFGGQGTVPLHPDSLFGRAAAAMGFKTKEPQSANERVSGAFDALSKKEHEETVARGTARGVLDAFRDWKAQNDAKGFADGLKPMSYSPGGGTSRGGYFGSKEFPAMPDGSGVGGGAGSVPKSMGKGPDGSSVPMGGDGQPMPTSGTLAEQRKRFAQELEQKPWLRDKLLRIAANEQGKHPVGTQNVIEETMNRAIVRGTSLEKEARWTGEGGYYAMGNMGRGALENPSHRAILEQGLKNALAGSNSSNFATDNASSWLAAKHKRTGNFAPTGPDVHGETFFGPDNRIRSHIARWQAWKEGVMAADQQGRGARLSDMIRRGRRGPSDAELLKRGMRASDAGGALNSSLGVKIDLNGFPKGTRVSTSQEGGLLKEVALRRGRSMPLASENS